MTRMCTMGAAAAMLWLGCAGTGAPASADEARGSWPQGTTLSQAPAGFWDHWGDGRGELAGYTLSLSRYGEVRGGEAVLITVTEDFTAATRVKSDGGHGDEFPVVKLNEVRDFQTGIYDYNTMTSAWLPLDGRLPLGQVSKLSFSMQEWCGHVYEQLTVDPGRLQRTGHSYFDGEADVNEAASVPEDAVFIDALPLLVRGLAGELVAPGGTRDVALYAALPESRMGHTPPSFSSGRIHRSDGTRALTVPAGTFDVETWTVEGAGKTRVFEVESAIPRRLVAFSVQSEDGVQVQATLTGVVRTAYWQQHGNGDEARRADLGLPARTWPSGG